MPSLREPPVETGADDIQAHPRRTGLPLVDLALALSAIFISAVSLAVAIEHGRTERDLVAASSWPFLRALYSNSYGDGDARFAAIGVSNGGVGPAKLESYEVFYDGKPASSQVDLLRRCCGLGPTADDYDREVRNKGLFGIVDRTVMRPGEANVVVGVRRGTPVGDRLADALLHLSFRACYCSILDQCWVSDLRSTRVRAVKACPEPPVRFDPTPPTFKP
jgi:hypothetical protein